MAWQNIPALTDWQYEDVIRALRHNTGTARVSVQALYSAIMNLVDDAGFMDDTIPMSAQTPTEFSLINGWFIDDDSMAFLKGGSIVTFNATSGWDAATYANGIYRITLQAGGYVNCVAGDIGKTVTDGTRTGTLLAYNNTTRKWWVRRGTGTAWSGALTITTGTGAGTITGSVLTGEDVWGNFYNLGSLKSGNAIYVEQNGVAVSYSGWGYTSGDLDVLVRVRENSTDINSKNVAFFAHNLGDSYDCFTATASATGGRNPVPITTGEDISDDASGGSVVGVTVGFSGPYAADVDGDGSNENYDVQVDGGGNTMLNVYRRLKYLLRQGETSTLNGLQGQFYRSFNPGTYSEVKNSAFGSMPGSVFFGARGVLITNISDPNNRSLIDSAGNTRNPPVSIVATVTGLVSGDRVLVARSSSGVINKSMLTLDGVHSSATTVTVNEAIPASLVPSSGVIRIGDTRHTYSGVNRTSKQFTGVSPGLSGAGGAAIWVPLIDDVASGASMASGSLTYASDFEVTARVRKYASGAGNSILPFENSVQVTNAGASIAAIRTVDSVAT